MFLKKKWLQATEELDSPDAEDVGFVMQESNQSGKAVMVVSWIQFVTI